MSASMGVTGENAWMRPAAMVLSLVASVVYFVIAFGFVPDGFESPPAPVMFVAGAAYLVGGILIMRVGRRLLRVGLILNLVVLALFVLSAMSGNATVDALGLVGKAGQVGLAVVLALILRSEDGSSRTEG